MFTPGTFCTETLSQTTSSLESVRSSIMST